MFKSIIAICLVGVMLVVFQNCGSKQFSLRTDLNKSMSLDGSEQLVEDDVPNEIENEVDDVVNNDDGSSTGGSSSDGSTSASSSGDDDDHDEVVKNDDHPGNSNGGNDSSGSTSASSSGDDDDKDEVAENDDDDKKEEHSEKDKKEGHSCHDKKDGNGRYVCILAGPGKSRHVAVINDQIVAENSTPKTACMSRDACEKIVGAKLEVKSVESRGYCKNETPQVLVFTDAEIQALVDKIK